MRKLKMAKDLSHVFVTSDHHFGSWKLPGPFKVFAKEQEDVLIEKWNSVVGKDDVVYYNGDFCDGNVKDLIEYASQLNGKIILVLGNHDDLGIDVYRLVFKDGVYTEVILNPNNLTIHHCPGNAYGKHEVFGHLHRDGEDVVNKIENGFCSCVQVNDGYPISLEKVLASFK